MQKPPKESPAGGPAPSQDLPADDHDTRSLSDDATFGDQSMRGPKSLGDEATFGDGLGGSDSELFDDNMEIVDLETRYTIESTLGKGGMGEVLLATDTRLNRKVAIKRILGSATRSKTAVNRFLIEAQSIAALNHPNIVQIFDYGRAKDGPFLIMEYVEGNSLLDRCREGAIPAEESIDLICQLCDGLGTAHAANIIHRDIKPANVLLTTSNVPKLTDFGLAKDEAADTGMTMQGAVLGTLDFMPPEQRKDASLTDARSDLWSLAATFYQMVTGESPRVIDLDEVPSELRKCIGKALKSRKEDRYQTAVDLRAAIQEALSNQTIEPAPTVELGAGECSQCHARNEASRKFCNSCGASLRNPCLQCEVEIPVWDKFCPECGSDQHVILKEKINGFNQQLVRAEELLSSYAFDQSRTIVDPVAALADTRFGEVVGRAGKLQITIEARRKQEFQTAENKFDEAQRNMAAFDYESAIRVLSGVPEPLHQQVAAGNDTLDVYLAGLVAKKAELESLMQVIKQRVKDRNLNGLLEQVNRAAKLDGSSQPIQKLQSQLRKRDAARKEKYDEIHQRASEQLAEGNAKAALRTVSQTKEDGFPDKLRELKKKLTNLVELENELVGLVKEAKADGVIDAIEVYKLLPKAEHYLKLNPHKKSINKLVEDLYFKVVQAWQSKYHDFASSGGKSSVLAVELLRDLRDIIDEFPISQRKASFNELTKKQVEDLHLCVEQSFQNKFAALMKKNSGSEELCINLLRDLRDFIEEFPACKRIASFNEMNQKLTEYVKALPLNKLKGLPFELAQIIFEEEIASKSGMGKINLISDLRKYCS